MTSAGPVTNTISSATPSAANAVCRSASSSSRWAQRLRTREPNGGIAAPATTANRCGTTSGQPSVIETIIAVVAMANSTASTHSTRGCPNRSTSRPCHTAATALPMM